MTDVIRCWHRCFFIRFLRNLRGNKVYPKEENKMGLGRAKKTIPVFLATLMLLLPLAACGKKNDPQPSGTSEEITTPEPTTDTAVETDENGYIKDALGTKKFGGAKVNISGWSEQQRGLGFSEFDVSTEEMNNDPVSKEVYLRNLSVETRLNVNLSFSTTTGWTGPGDGSGQEQNQLVQNLAGTEDLHLVATYSMNPATLMMKGLLADLTEMPNLNLFSPWWNQSIVQKCSIYGHTYYATGDIAPSFLSQIIAVFFNKEFATNQGLGDLYDVFREDRWTLDEMMSITKDLGLDLTQDGVKNVGDQFGIALTQVCMDAFYQGSGMLTVENAADGSVQISDDFRGDKTQALLKKLVDYFKTDDAFHGFTASESAQVQNIWTSGKDLFIVQPIGDIRYGIQKGITNFGLLPMPKYDSEQSDYYTTTGFYYTMYGVAKVAAKSEVMGAVLECMASEGYRRVTPAYYEKTVKTQYSSTVDEYQMFQYLRDHTVIDSGRVFSKELSQHTWWDFRQCVGYGSADWTSTYKGFSEKIEKKIASLNDTVLIFAGR